jgi:hypothetical protein
MGVRAMFFLAAVVVFVATLAVVAIYYYRRARNITDRTWEQLLSRLTFVDRESVALIALAYADESGRRRSEDTDAELKPSQIWSLIGGLKGLEALESNCAVLIDMAFYVQRWYPEAVVLAEELRLNAREIEWHVERLRGAEKRGNLELSFADYAQPAIAKYYLMTRRVLLLYERGSLPMFSDLQGAI